MAVVLGTGEQTLPAARAGGTAPLQQAWEVRATLRSDRARTLAPGRARFIARRRGFLLAPFNSEPAARTPRAEKEAANASDGPTREAIQPFLSRSGWVTYACDERRKGRKAPNGGRGPSKQAARADSDACHCQP